MMQQMMMITCNEISKSNS